MIHQDTISGLVLFLNKFYSNFYLYSSGRKEDYNNVFSSNYKRINSIFIGGFLARLFKNYFYY